MQDYNPAVAIQLDLGAVERERALAAWLVYHGIERKKLATQLGITPGAMTRIIQGKHRPPKRIKRLVELGIPACLLPPCDDIT